MAETSTGTSPTPQNTPDLACPFGRRAWPSRERAARVRVAGRAPLRWIQGYADSGEKTANPCDCRDSTARTSCGERLGCSVLAIVHGDARIASSILFRETKAVRDSRQRRALSMRRRWHDGRGKPCRGAAQCYSPHGSLNSKTAPPHASERKRVSHALRPTVNHIEDGQYVTSWGNSQEALWSIR